jgi:hypothetical protein
VIRGKIEAELAEAKRLSEYFAARVRERGTAVRRTTAMERAEAACATLASGRDRLDAWRASVTGELDAYCAQVRGLTPEIEELEQYRALSRIEATAVSLAAEAERAIADATIDLMTRIQTRCGALSDALRDAGVRVAVGASDCTSDRGIHVLESTVDDLVGRVPVFEAASAEAEFNRPLLAERA